MSYAFAKHGIAYWKHVSHWNRKKMKNENPKIFIDIDQFCLEYTKNFETCTKSENFPFSKLTVFTIFSSHKHKIYQSFF